MSSTSVPDSVTPAAGPRRRGRPAAGTESERRDRVLDGALAVLVSDGAERLTMAAVARRAGASKETLYRWFGDRDGLLAALIQRNADRSAERVAEALNATGAPECIDEFRDTLVDYAAGLLGLLTGDASVALNRAAMTDPQLRTLLLREGRHRVGPLVERYLERGEDVAAISLSEVGGAGSAFELLYGLVVRDTQITVLLGAPPPSAAVVRTRATTAVDQFLGLCRPAPHGRAQQ